MIWQNPWAWLGLLALAVPVLVHLLGQRSARAQRFPTLRFIDATAPVATRFTRLSDIPLLLVRMAIIAAAVAALALPLLLTANRERQLGRTIARAIIVDTSESVRGIAGDAARRLATDAVTSVIIETRDPTRALQGAAAWLGHQPGRHEIVIVSDFQRGTIDSVDIARIPTDVGITLVRVATEPLTALPSVSTTGDGGGLTVLAGDADLPRIAAARSAAVALGGELLLPSERLVAIVYESYAGRDSLLRRAGPLTAPWQGDVLATLRADPTLTAAAATAELSAVADSTSFGDPLRPPFTAVARTSGRDPILVAAADSHETRARLLVFVRTDAGSLVSAATFAALARAASPAPNVTELDPARIEPARLAAWQRPAAAATSTRAFDDAGASDGRWLWLLALALLGVEGWMRRARRQVKAAEVVRERAA